MKPLALSLLLLAAQPSCPVAPMAAAARPRPVSRTLRVELTEQRVTLTGEGGLWTVGFDQSLYRPCRIEGQYGQCSVRRAPGTIAVWRGGANGRIEDASWKEE